MYIMHKTDMVFAIYLGTGIQAELVDSQLISTSGTKIIIVSGTNRSKLMVMCSCTFIAHLNLT